MMQQRDENMDRKLCATSKADIRSLLEDGVSLNEIVNQVAAVGGGQMGPESEESYRRTDIELKRQILSQIERISETLETIQFEGLPVTIDDMDFLVPTANLGDEDVPATQPEGINAAEAARRTTR